MPHPKPLVLIADDTPHDRDRIVRYFPRDKYEVVFAETVDQAREVMQGRHIYLALVDLYFDLNNESPYGIELLQEFQHVPTLLMSGQNESRVEDALRHFDDRRLRLLDKDKDFETREAIAKSINEHLLKHYNEDIAFRFTSAYFDWEAIAKKFAQDDEDPEKLGLELQCLAQKAFYGWDLSRVESSVRATQIDIAVLESGTRSAVMSMRPRSSVDEEQSDVIFKIARVRAERDEHSAFDKFKNVVGGFGLRERRYSRTCNFHGQLYAVPYFAFEDTQTYEKFYAGVLDATDESLGRIRNLTNYLFSKTLRPIHKRRLTGSNLKLSDYYAERIEHALRAENIKAGLINQLRPVSLSKLFADETMQMMHVKIGKTQVKPMRNPVEPVLEKRLYGRVDQLVPTSLRHGDMHTANVLVDAEDGRLACWYIDYEHFSEQHFVLIDHVEFEGTILFKLMKPSDHFAYLAALIEAITPEENITQLDMSIVDLAPDASTKVETQKLLNAIHEIRESAQGMDPDAKTYYQALMYEALRIAGKRSIDNDRRWFAFITAAQLFAKIEG